MEIVFAEIPVSFFILVILVVVIVLGFKYQYGKYYRNENNPGFIHYLVPQKLSPADEKLLQNNINLFNNIMPEH